MINSVYTPPLQLLRRPRRNRQSAAIRALVREQRITAHDLVQPLFVQDGSGTPEPIGSLPGQSRHTVESMVQEAARLAQLGLHAVALFPQIEPSLKDARGSLALSKKNWFLAAVKTLKTAVPELLIIADVALDPYTDHGHDGVLDPLTGDVANDETVHLLGQYANLLAAAGTDIVAPSDMMDGRIAAIREELDHEGFSQTAILAYAAKFASAYYGPFRDAVGSAQSAPLDKQSYQMDPANAREARMEARLDENEGADILMVKPAGLYLDVIAVLRSETDLPLAAYQVSGEYAQIHAAAQAGYLDLKKARDESLLAIKRAGAGIIFSYFAREVAEELQQQK